MPVFAGRVLLPDRVADGWLDVTAGRIQGCGLDEAPPERPHAEGWIVPAPVNAHTHAADTALRGRPGMPTDLAQAVGPGGWKHRGLTEVGPDGWRAGAGTLSRESAAVGAATLVDFREGGLPGVQAMADAALDASVQWYGRPAAPTFDEDEANALLPAVDGIGLSALRDFPRPRDAHAWAEACHDAHVPLALHVSEARRENMEDVLSLAPRHLVHACHATASDLRRASDADVPVVVCPRSNRTFGLRPPVPAMLAAGVRVTVGTDNGMLQDGDIWKELALLHAWWPDLPLADLLRMATHHGRAVAGLPVPTTARGAPADWIVLPSSPLPAAPSGRPAMEPIQSPQAPPTGDA